MKTLQADVKQVSIPAARLALGGAIGAVVLLALLHVLSPELDPSWRMVSEYANGDYGWVLSFMFAAWGIASLSLTYALWSQIKTRGGKIGLVLLAIAGIGQLLAAVFDINHALHDMVGNIAIPSFAVAAVLVSRGLSKTQPWDGARARLMRMAHLTWISVVLLVVSFVVLISTYMSSGGDVNSGAKITELPEGVVALVGWANRLLVVVYAAWVAVVAGQAIKLRQGK